MGTLTSLAFVLTVEDPSRFPKCRSVGSYLGLRPRQQDSGASQPQLHITKAGDQMLRCLLVECAHHMLGGLGTDSDLRRWGLKLAERGGRNAKKRAAVAVARKLSVLLLRLWATGEGPTIRFGTRARAVSSSPLRHRVQEQRRVMQERSTRRL